MNTIAIEELAEEDNESGLSLETLGIFAKAIDDSIDSLNWNNSTGKRSEHVGLVPTGYDTDENRLVGFIEDSSSELIDIEILFDRVTEEDLFEEGNVIEFLTLSFDEGMESRLIENDAVQGDKDIRESLRNILNEEFQFHADEEEL